MSNPIARPDHLPWIWGDYNTIGLSDEPDDDCIYSLERAGLARLRARAGLRLFVYDHDGIGDDGVWAILGQICALEYVPTWRGVWRARPLHDDFYRGPPPDHDQIVVPGHR